MNIFVTSSCALTILLFSSVCSAFTLNVTKFTDSFDGVCDSDCSLREAVRMANIRPGKDRIVLGAGTYSLTIYTPNVIDYGIEDEDLNVNGDIDITDDIEIIGSDSGVTIIDGTENDRVFEIISGTVFLKHLTVIRGRTTHYGGAIENHAALTIDRSIIRNNHASGGQTPGTGGGVANWGSLKIYSSKFINNFSSAGEGYEGRGGAIYNTGDLVIRDTTFQANGTRDDNDSSKGSGIYSTGTADIRRSLFTQHGLNDWGYGAAIMNVSGTMKIVSSTISGNGGGEFARGAVANGSPGDAAGKLYLTNVTIVNNRDFGLYTFGDTYIRNSIISGNLKSEYGTPGNCYSRSGVFDSYDLLLGDGNNVNCASDYEIPNDTTFTTLLNTLSDNGGLTLSHMPKEGSMVIDQGQGQCPTSDQRGYFTNLDGDNDGVAKCDLGAIEYQP